MKLNSLEQLHRSMQSLGIEMQQFRARTGAAEFDCLFSTRETPFILSLTSRGENPKFFKFEVKPGYRISDYFGEIYSNLVSVLRIDGRSGEKLIPKNFLAQLDLAIPTTATERNIPGAESILKNRHDLEERDKPFFDTWIYWKEEGKPSPSQENLHKTLVVLGSEAHEYSLAMNASSRWSAVPTRRLWNNSIKEIGA